MEEDINVRIKEQIIKNKEQSGEGQRNRSRKGFLKKRLIFGII